MLYAKILALRVGFMVMVQAVGLFQQKSGYANFKLALWVFPVA